MLYTDQSLIMSNIQTQRQTQSYKVSMDFSFSATKGRCSLYVVPFDVASSFSKSFLGWFGIISFYHFCIKDKDKQYWCSVIATPLGSKNNFHLWYEASSFTPQGSAAFYNLRALDTEWCPFANCPLCANFLSAQSVKIFHQKNQKATKPSYSLWAGSNVESRVGS